MPNVKRPNSHQVVAIVVFVIVIDLVLVDFERAADLGANECGGREVDSHGGRGLNWGSLGAWE